MLAFIVYIFVINHLVKKGLTLMPTTLKKKIRKKRLTRLQLSPTILNSKYLQLWAERDKQNEN